MPFVPDPFFSPILAHAFHATVNGCGKEMPSKPHPRVSYQGSFTKSLKISWGIHFFAGAR